MADYASLIRHLTTGFRRGTSTCLFFSIASAVADTGAEDDLDSQTMPAAMHAYRVAYLDTSLWLR